MFEPRSLVTIAVASLACAAPCPAFAQDALLASSAPVPAVSAPGPVVSTRNIAQPVAPLHMRLTLGGKLTYTLGGAVSFRNFLETGFVAGIPNLPSPASQPADPINFDFATLKKYDDSMSAYGDSMDAWRRSSEEILRYHARRAEVGFATAETRNLLSNFVLPAALHQDPRYLPASFNSSFGARMAHALTSVVITRTDSGGIAPNYSKLLGTTGAAFIGKSFYADQFKAPELNSTRFAEKYIAYSLAGDAATNLSRELIRSALRQDLENHRSLASVTEDTYEPLSNTGKLFYWMQSTYGFRNFAAAALLTGVPRVDDVPTLPDEPPINTEAQAIAYERVVVKYADTERLWRDTTEENIRFHGRKFLGGLSEAETQQFLQNAFIPIVFGMDSRYIALGSDHPAAARIGHALTGLVLTRTTSGHRTVNLPILGGTIGAAFIAREYYYPALNVDTLSRGNVLGKTIGLNLLADVVYNLGHELFNRRSPM